MPSRCFWLQFCFAQFALGKLEVHVADTSDDGQHLSPPGAAFFGLLFGVEARRYGVMPIHLDILWSYTSCLRARVRHNNNNTIWGGSVSTGRGASTLPWGAEACFLPSRRPNPIPAITPYVVKTPHLHGAPTTEETSFVKPDTNARKNKNNIKKRN